MASFHSNRRKITDVMKNIPMVFELTYLLDEYPVTFKDAAIYTSCKQVFAWWPLTKKCIILTLQEKLRRSTATSGPSDQFSDLRKLRRIRSPSLKRQWLEKSEVVVSATRFFLIISVKISRNRTKFCTVLLTVWRLSVIIMLIPVANKA